MLTITKEFQPELTYPLEKIAEPESILFFDIETTGFSGDYCSVYLIGCVFFKGGKWYLRQWFADTKKAEPEVLNSFFSFLKDYSVLIHFNGDGFDLPFLMKRCSFYGLPHSFESLTSYDIYKKIKPLKKLLSLDSLKQKAIEAFLGISREDKFTGGDLISVYKEYLITKEQFLERLLLLHNEDDLKGMPQILPILSYTDLPGADFSYVNYDLTPQRDLILTGTSGVRVPVPFVYETTDWKIQAADTRVAAYLKLYEGELRFYHPDYKNYYYLPQEDCAIHKSLGEFVDKAHRQKATAQTCYTRLNSRFLPQWEPIYTPSLKREYKDKTYYASFRPEMFDDPDSFSAFFRHLFRFVK